jgi:hypothetical protein
LSTLRCLIKGEAIISGVAGPIFFIYYMKNSWEVGKLFCLLHEKKGRVSKFQKLNKWVYPCIDRRACGHVDVGTRPHQVLAGTLTLSQPGEGGQIMPTLYWCPHQVLKDTGAPEFEHLRHYHLQVQANSKKIVQKNQCYF